jgi:hypothetical protein
MRALDTKRPHLVVAVGVVLLAGVCLAGFAWHADAAEPPPKPSATPAPSATPSSKPSPAPPAVPSEAPTGVPAQAPSNAPSGTEPGGGTSGDGQGGKDECGWIDVGCHAKQAITGWFGLLVGAALKPVIGTLAATQFSTPEIGSAPMKRAEQIWATSLAIADTCFVLLVSLAGVMLMAGQTFAGETSPREIVPRLVAAFIALNTSLIWIGYGIQLANGLAAAILMDGTDKIEPSQAGRVLAEGIEASINTGGAFYTLVSLVAVVLATILLFGYVMRLAIIMVLIAVAPVALMFHALALTDGLARLWWRGMTGMLAIQVCQSFVFITALQLLLSQHSDNNHPFFGVPTEQAELIDLLLVIALLYVLICIPRWVARTVWQPAKPRMFTQLVKTFLVYKGIGALNSAAGQALRSASATRRAPGGRARPGPGGAGNRPNGGPHGGPHGGGPDGPHRPGPRPDHGPGHSARPDEQRGQGQRPRPGPTPRTGPSGPQTGGRAGNGRPQRPAHHAAPRDRTAPRPPGGGSRTIGGGTARPQPPIRFEPSTRPHRSNQRSQRSAPRAFVRVDPPRRRRYGRRNR